MNYSISDTAEYGNYSRGPRVITAAVRQEMQRILDEIQSGAFAREWIAECEAGWPNMERLRTASRTHPVEAVGRQLRAMMPWLKPHRPADTAASPVELVAPAEA
jgi:ketol-acid reductoisomerase